MFDSKSVDDDTSLLQIMTADNSTVAITNSTANQTLSQYNLTSNATTVKNSSADSNDVEDYYRNTQDQDDFFTSFLHKKSNKTANATQNVTANATVAANSTSNSTKNASVKANVTKPALVQKPTLMNSENLNNINNLVKSD